MLVVIVGNTILGCSTTNGKPIHYVNQNGSRAINTFIGFSFSHNSMMVSTINYLNFSSYCQSCGPFPFDMSLFLKTISLHAHTPSGGSQHHVDNNLLRFLYPKLEHNFCSCTFLCIIYYIFSFHDQLTNECPN
jgi:hypothetical protein